MKRLLLSFALATVIVPLTFGQQNAGTVPTGVLPVTTPANISQLEAQGRAITQNFQSSPVLSQITGSFDPKARWNTMGSIPASSQLLNGFRTQTDGRALAWGHSIPNGGTVSNPFIEWIGNNAAAPIVRPGNLEFRYALNSTGAAAARVPIFTMAPTSTSNTGVVTPSFNYAERDAFVGQLQKGTLGSFGSSDIWSATGPITTPSFNIYGSRHQYNGYTVNTGFIENLGTSNVTAIMDYGFNSTAGLGSYIFKFRSFSDPANPASTRNVWQTSTKLNNVVFGLQDYTAVNNGQFQVSVFDGVASAASSTSVNFVERAGLYVTGDGVNPNIGPSPLKSYAAVVGDVSGVTLAGGATAKYAILGIADGNYTGGSSFASNAAYFVGNVFYTGGLIPVSDQKFKKDVNTEENIMPRLMKLQPKSYVFDVDKYKNMAFSNKLQHGLISQEVEKVFPELVVEAFAPNTSSDKNEDGKPVAYKGLNYMGLISMLLKGIQEQQVQIDELKSKIAANTSNTLVVNDKNPLPVEIQNRAFALSQNIPNPFSENTTINYTVPATAGKVILAIFDLNGKMLLQYNLQQGKNNIVVKGNTLSAGMYLYSLIADGQEVLSKKMVLTK
jgi:hypothetical protein